mmetsp:Transcript_26040/g.36378  ORF Transcript_26040/g.36378 Transcript_26040/m.36378 type:complete len:175 (+) Transcript_26040:94-618(+)
MVNQEEVEKKIRRPYNSYNLSEIEAVVRRYFVANSSPVDLEGLWAIMSEDVVAEYPSSTSRGLQQYKTNVTRNTNAIRSCFCYSRVKPTSFEIFKNDDSKDDEITVIVPWTYSAMILCCCPLCASGVNIFTVIQSEPDVNEDSSSGEIFLISYVKTIVGSMKGNVEALRWKHSN